jgi:hypothetical protein
VVSFRPKDAQISEAMS